MESKSDFQQMGKRQQTEAPMPRERTDLERKADNKRMKIRIEREWIWNKHSRENQDSLAKAAKDLAISIAKMSKSTSKVCRVTPNNARGMYHHLIFKFEPIYIYIYSYSKYCSLMHL